MDDTQDPSGQAIADAQRAVTAPSSSKQPWQEPKLTFVEPKLTPHGKLAEVTAAFFQQFTP